MPDPITRRRFLRDAALLSGAAVLVDPRLVLGRAQLRARVAAPAAAARRAEGVFTLVQYGGADDEFLLRGTRTGGDYVFELTPVAVVFQVPNRSTGTAEVIELAEFEQGLGHDVLSRHFGPEALDQLRTEVSHRAIFGQA